MFPVIQSFQFEMARIVKALMESPPADDQKKAVEALLKRMELKK